ncbi:MAG: hypothetical protein HYS87_00715 [Candidatus Colwellbacteria bacterium]|nr:hypothetical protein [Candidatus Colwellbacteria bacterium]
MLKRYLITGLLIIPISLIGFLSYQNGGTAYVVSPLQLEAYANEVIEICTNDSYRPSCYDKEIPKLMDNISMEDAFKVTVIIQQKDTSYPYCHVLGHNLSAREVQKDPSNWKEVLARCPSGVCSNGCLHGGLQEKFRGEYPTEEELVALKPDLFNICEKKENWNPTGLEQASCYHALGHLSMYLTKADIYKSLDLCKEMALKPDGRDYQQLCFDGAFMQIFQPLEPEDFALVEGKEPAKEEVYSFCSKFTGQQRGSCWSETWPLFREELQKPEGLVAHCEKSDLAERQRCYNALVYVLTAQFSFDSERIKNYCSGLPAGTRELCFANASSRMIETDYRNIDLAVQLCSEAALFDKDGECFQELIKYSTFNFHAGSEQFFKICNAMPEPWSSKCLNNPNANYAN